MPRGRGGEDGGGQRRHGQRQSEAEHEQPRQHRAEVGRTRLHAAQKREPGGDAQRPDGHWQAWSDAVGQQTGSCGQDQHDGSNRQHRDASLQRRVAEDLLKMDNEKEERDAKS